MSFVREVERRVTNLLLNIDVAACRNELQRHEQCCARFVISRREVQGGPPFFILM